jgi:hypothetical protein
MVIIYLFLHKKEDKKAIQMTKLNLLTLFIIIFLSGLPSTQAVWITYKTFTGYIPSYTYPITLNAGDNLRAILSWPGA